MNEQVTFTLPPVNNTHTFNSGERRWLSGRRCLYELRKRRGTHRHQWLRLARQHYQHELSQRRSRRPHDCQLQRQQGGINQLTRAMVLTLIDNRIRVNAIARITIATELAAKAVLISEEAKAKIMSHTPMKRLGELSKIANTVAYLASDAVSYITGEILMADGQWMVWNYTVSVRCRLWCYARKVSERFFNAGSKQTKNGF